MFKSSAERFKPMQKSLVYLGSTYLVDLLPAQAQQLCGQSLRC